MKCPKFEFPSRNAGGDGAQGRRVPFGTVVAIFQIKASHHRPVRREHHRGLADGLSIVPEDPAFPVARRFGLHRRQRPRRRRRGLFRFKRRRRKSPLAFQSSGPKAGAVGVVRRKPGQIPARPNDAVEGRQKRRLPGNVHGAGRQRKLTRAVPGRGRGRFALVVC